MRPSKLVRSSGMLVCQLLAGAGLLFVATLASADIMIAPTRAVLDENNRQATITLRNPGQSERAYRLRWTERRVQDDGRLARIPDGENPQSAAGMVRFSPRRVVVGPGQLQTVRLDYRPPADLAPGEYRSHLVIGLEPNQSGTPMEESPTEGISLQLNALISFSLPVIVRHGSGSAAVAITSITPEHTDGEHGPSPALRVNLNRTGPFSAYGRLTVYQQMNADAPVVEIGRAGNVAIYSEVGNYSRVIPLDENVELRSGSWIRVAYEGVDREFGQVFAEQTLQLR